MKSATAFQASAILNINFLANGDFMQQRVFFIFVFLLLFFAPSPSWSSEVDNQASYHEWLKRYGAMDVYAMSVREREAGVTGQLDYAEALISLGNPEGAVSVLRSIETKGDPRLEGEKHWLIHRALRQLGEFDQSCLAVVETSGFLGTEKTSELMTREPGLDKLWINVWKRWFFHSLSPDHIIDGRRTIMEQSVVLAKSAWPDSAFWKRIELPLSGDRHMPSGPTSDQVRIARAFALWGISNWGLAEQTLAGVSDHDLKSFFMNFGRFLKTANLNIWDTNLKTPKSSGFTDVYADHLLKYALENFRLSSPQAGSWASFLDRVRELSPAQALELIQKELTSALLSDEVRERLQSLSFIYELQERPYTQALDTWKTFLSNSSDLPFTLYLAGSLIEQCYAPLTNLPASRYPFFKEILNAAGLNLDQRHLAGFWDREQNDISLLYTDFPLDYALNHLFYHESFLAHKDQDSARNLAFLFPYSEPGQSAYLSMAQHAYKDGNKALAWNYLQNITQEFASGPRQLDLLEAKAGILMDMGREEESLSTYQVILEKSPQRLGPERRLKLALLAQEKNRWKPAQEMLEALWHDRSALPDPIQAEVLFWLGEGAQHQGQLEQALDYYLRLSWKFPEQNIWAVTAMYRAGLIYEQRGMLDTARNLFQTVLRSADRDSQKEAARQRLDAIESRLGAGADRDGFLF